MSEKNRDNKNRWRNVTIPVCTSVSVGTAGHGRAAGCGKYG